MTRRHYRFARAPEFIWWTTGCWLAIWWGGVDEFVEVSQ